MKIKHVREARRFFKAPLKCIKVFFKAIKFNIISPPPPPQLKRTCYPVLPSFIINYGPVHSFLPDFDFLEADSVHPLLHAWCPGWHMVGAQKCLTSPRRYMTIATRALPSRHWGHSPSSPATGIWRGPETPTADLQH